MKRLILATFLSSLSAGPAALLTLTVMRALVAAGLDDVKAGFWGSWDSVISSLWFFAIAASVALQSMIVLGLPVYFALRRLGILREWLFIGAAFIAGAVIANGMIGFRGIGVLIFGAIPGAAVATTFWLIVFRQLNTSPVTNNARSSSTVDS